MKLQTAIMVVVFSALAVVSKGEIIVKVGHKVRKFQLGGKDGGMSPTEVSRSFLSFPKKGILRFNKLTVKEAAQLGAPVCHQFGPDALSDCYRDVGRKDYLLNHLSPACIRSIPHRLFATIGGEDIPILGESFLSNVTVAQVKAFKQETRLALSDKQLIVLLRSTQGGVTEPGLICSGLSKDDVIKIEKKRPTVIKALTADCIKHLGKALAGVGSNIIKERGRFAKLRIANLHYLQKSYITEEVAQAIIEGGADNCIGLTSEAIHRLPESKRGKLAKDCWQVATKNRREKFNLSARMVQELPDTAWVAVTGFFLKTISIKGSFSSPVALKGLLSNVAKDNPSACRGIYGLVKAINNPTAISFLAPECLAQMNPSQLTKIESSRILDAFPTKTISILTRQSIAALQPEALAGVSEAFGKALNENPRGCAGLAEKHLTAASKKGRFLSFLSAKCVGQISKKTLFSLPSESIAKFGNTAFSLLTRIDFNLDDQLDNELTNLLTAMRPEQIKSLGDATKSELHVCHAAPLELAKIMTGLDERATSKRRSAVGIALEETNCLKVVHPISFSTLTPIEMKQLPKTIITSITNPEALSEISEESMATLTQSQLDKLNLSACSGLRAEQFSSLPKGLALNNYECLAAMHPKELPELIKNRNKIHLPDDVASLLTSAHVEHHLDLTALNSDDFEHLGRRVPEALNPCHATNISLDSMPNAFWQKVDRYCFASLPKLKKASFPKIKKLIDVGKLGLLSQAQIRSLEKAWGVTIKFVDNGVSEIVTDSDEKTTTIYISQAS